jgi:hypothetical protein
MIVCPFHYEVRFKLLSFNEKNEILPQFAIYKFSDGNPILSRNKAFEAFEEFLLYKEQYLTIIDFNPRIKQPVFINKEIHKRIQHISDFDKFKEEPLFINKEIYESLVSGYEFDKFKEEFEIYLIIDDKDKFEEIAEDLDTELVIHKVASYDFDPQDLLDNLMNEFTIYKHCGYETAEEEITVEHYGTDYFEAGQHPQLAFVEILKTPFIWNSDKDIEEENHRKHILKHSEEESGQITIKDIIRIGETNTVEFKSSLLYNFKSGKGGASIKYIIAKCICGFLNSREGGLLLIGVRDDNGEIQGVEYDFSLFGENPKDKFRNEFDSLLQYYFPPSVLPSIVTQFQEINEKNIFLIQIKKNIRPIMLYNQYMNKKEFFVRREASTREIIDIEEIIDYVFSNWITND